MMQVLLITGEGGQVVEQGGGGGASETKQNKTHTGRQTGCVLALEIILNIFCRIGGTLYATYL